MHAGFGLEPAIGVFAADAEGRGLEPGGLARALLQPFDLIAVGLGPARVHAHQLLRPVLGFGAAGAGVGFEVTVVGVGLAREQGL